jgi:secreted PhoX family phosphatase
VERPALGRFVHEAAAVDGARRHVYLTEDKPDGRLYRTRLATAGDLRAGTLEVARVDGGHVTWLPVPDPTGATTPTRRQVPDSTEFAGGEGIWWTRGRVVFTTKGDHRVWRLHPASGRIEVLHDGLAAGGALGEPDNVTVAPNGDVYVCEDQDADQEVVAITRYGTVFPVLRLVGHTGSELAGVAFTPAGDRMYVSSQRGSDDGPGPGITYEVRGPFAWLGRRWA